MTKLNEKQIAAYEAKGFNRWTKGNMDRLYINCTSYGCRFSYYNTGNIHGAWFNDERVSNAEGYRFKSTKVYIDVNTGELSITTSTDYEDEIREAIESIMAEVERETAEPETDEPDYEKEAEKMFREGCKYPLDGTDAELVRRITYKTIGNGYLNEVLDAWQLADNLISAADLLLDDGIDVSDVIETVSSHIETTATLYDVR